MPGDEHQLSLPCPGFAPLQIMLRMNRFIVFVNSEEADVEVVARIFKVIRVAAVKGDLLLRREHQTHIGVALEAIEVILPALIQRDDVAAQLGFVL